MKEKVFEFLDALRESGITNMFGASTYVLEEFDELTEEEAKQYLIEWMRTFKERHS